MTESINWFLGGCEHDMDIAVIRPALLGSPPVFPRGE
jgi:hypothetical protein